MGAMFNQILAIFQGFFSRAFWFGNFLPVVIAAAAHVLIATLHFSESNFLGKWVSGSAAENAALLSFSFVLFVVFAYAFAPLIPLFRSILDGRQVWGRLNNNLRRERVIEARRIQDRIAAASELYGEFDWFNRNQGEWFEKASEEGSALRTAADENSIATAERTVADLRKQIDRAKLPPPVLADRAFTAVCDALRRKPMGSIDRARSERLANAQRMLEKLLGHATSEARYQFESLSARFEARLALDNPQATRIGDARLLTERYSFNAYKVDFEYIWPRLQLVLPDKSPFVDQLIAAKAQIDFAILALILILTLPAFWLPWLAFTARSPWLFLAVGTITPFVASFFYRLAVEAQFGFGEIVKSAIDRYRLDLLTTLRQPVPTTLSAERTLWQQLQQMARPGNLADYSYRHPAS
jgi:hypothetical protein